MKKYYAYIPLQDGTQPFGTDRKILFELKTDKGAIKKAKRLLSNEAVLFSYSNFYDSKTYIRII